MKIAEIMEQNLLHLEGKCKMNIIDHKVIKEEIFTLEPGTYIIGDPCYFVPDDKWNEVLESSKFFSAKEDGSALGYFIGKNGEKVCVIAFETAYGDGVYTDNHGHEFPVDAGLIGFNKVYMSSDKLHLNFRIPKDILARIEAIRAKMSEQIIGVEIERTKVMNLVFDRGLFIVERELKMK
jgi:hypothetical protein